MKEIYSTYEAKAKLSEILRQVRAGRTIRVSYRGEPVAEIRPIQRGPAGLAERLQELEMRGAVAGAEAGEDAPDRRSTGDDLRPVDRKRGALDRFLAERDG